jgi:hypothetical protein
VKIVKSSSELLRDSLVSWGQIYNRRLEDQAIEEWMKLFVNTPSRVLGRALDELTRNAERMPTPGMLTKAIGLMRQQGSFPGIGVNACTCKKCEGSGYFLEPVPGSPRYKQTRRCDCHPSHATGCKFISDGDVEAAGFGEAVKSVAEQKSFG